MALKTDYKDDVLDTSVNTQRKYNMIQNDDGTVSFEDVTEYLQTGDSFGAQELNEMNSDLVNQVLTFTNVSVATSAWAKSGRSDEYLYKATISCVGVTGSYMPNIAFGMAEAISGNFAPCASSGTNVVIIWAKKVPESGISIPTIQCIKSV